MLAEWKERSEKYKSRKFDNQLQQDVEDYLVRGLIAWGDEQGIGTYHKLMLEKGRWFLGRDKVKNHSICLEYRKKHRPKIKQCFQNSQLFVTLMDVDAQYYEGFVLAGIIPVMHAWVVMDDKVIDFTLEACDRKLKRERESIYIGVPIPNKFVGEKLIELRQYTPMAHMYYFNDTRMIID